MAKQSLGERRRALRAEIRGTLESLHCYGWRGFGSSQGAQAEIARQIADRESQLARMLNARRLLAAEASNPEVKV